MSVVLDHVQYWGQGDQIWQFLCQNDWSWNRLVLFLHCIIFDILMTFSPTLLFMILLLLVWVHLNMTIFWIIWNNILCQARISEFLFKWESSLLNDKYKYLYSTPILCYSVWIYNSKPVKRKIYTKKWRNILTLWFGTGHCAFHYGFIPLSSTLYFLSYLCLLSLQKLYDTDVFHQRYWQVHLLFNYSKLKHLILLHPDDSSLNLWGVV